MNLLRTVPIMALVALAVTAASCTRQVSPSADPARSIARSGELRGSSGLIKASDGNVAGERRDVYFGDAFSEVQKALGSQPQDAESPTF
jgi:hypothetical protein